MIMGIHSLYSKEKNQHQTRTRTGGQYFYGNIFVGNFFKESEREIKERHAILLKEGECCRLGCFFFVSDCVTKNSLYSLLSCLFESKALKGIN